jgi:hypothetical protein
MKSFTAALALIAPVQAGLRFSCSTLTIQRLDPVVQPGVTPSSHLHHIVGGNAFNANMTGDIGEKGTCTTCQMSEDFSNYWTAVLYFKHPTNGSYHRVPVIPVNPQIGVTGTNGGLVVYYTQFDLTKDNIAQQPVKAFQPVTPPIYVVLLVISQPTSLTYYSLGIPYDGWKPIQYRQSTSRPSLSMHPEWPKDVPRVV